MAVYRLDGQPEIWDVPIWHQSTGTAILTACNALLNPQAAVLLFFILSGYVLAESLQRNGSVGAFYVRRTFRILPALWVALLMTYGAAQINHSTVVAVSDWYQADYERTPSARELWQNLALLGFKVSPVTWTMRIELLGSLCIPWMLAFQRRASASLRLLMLLPLMALVAVTRNDFRYLICFYVGALLTDGRQWRWLATRGNLLLTVGVVICTTLRLSLIEASHAGVSVLIGTAGATLVLIGVLAQRRPTLESAPSRFLGRISYSLYLLHPAALGVCAVLLFEVPLAPVPDTMLLFLLSLIIAMPAAALNHRFVEMPLMRSGKRVSAWLDGAQCMGQGVRRTTG